ncbi:MAG TPA: macrolide family glycosyltransferase [Actinophytocola sp.]|uniref:macrolide family glycosyltransferase n=1 Tax=Actinophytocola sp. TaxID=1872138 RepID=UPI002DBFA890|nr:macrolide family glycosyltransferase [Actinophytocola sp.]HEU5471632.1 macrolide family glycosyltransferase [Actinophytocola sp.]
MGRHIAFLNNSGYGHVIPTLDVVTELVRRGHRVSYVTAEGPARTVAAAGATVVEYQSRLPELDLAGIVNTPDGTARLPGIYLTEAEGILRAATAHFVADRPDLVVYDVTVYHAGRILSRAWGVPAAQFLPVFASNEHFSLLEKMFGKVDPAGLRHPELVAFFNRLRRLLAAYGQSDTALEEFIGRVEGLNLVGCPRSFQYAGDRFDDRFTFVGPSVGAGVDVGEWTPPGDGRPVLLVSLGTTVNRRPGFWETCLAAFAELPWHVVLATHDGVDGLGGAVPPNVEVRSWVPFLAVLEHAAVAITHGGFGSIMGALYQGTPVIVVPDSPEARVNASRVAELGLGRVVRDGTLTAERLRGTVLDLAADQQTYRRVRDMRRDIRETGGGPHGADAIERYLTESRIVA